VDAGCGQLRARSLATGEQVVAVRRRAAVAPLAPSQP